MMLITQGLDKDEILALNEAYETRHLANWTKPIDKFNSENNTNYKSIDEVLTAIRFHEISSFPLPDFEINL